jgi:hypothetical protein
MFKEVYERERERERGSEERLFARYNLERCEVHWTWEAVMEM